MRKHARSSRKCFALTRKCAAACCLLAMAAACQRTPDGQLETRSPSGMHTITLLGATTAPSQPLTFYRTMAQIVCKGRAIGPVKVYEAHWMDLGFADKFQSPQCITPDVCRFRARTSSGDESILVIENNTRDVLDVLIVN